MAKANYTYDATVVRVIDGDTLAVDVDLGFYLTARMSCRLLGINSPEMSTPAGREAKDFLESLTPAGTRVSISSVKPDKYTGRFDGVVRVYGKDVAQELVSAGHAMPWDGRGAKP